MEVFDMIIIGSGQGGTPLAKKMAGAGRKTLLVEKRFVGGTCVNDGCTPTKTLLSSARMAYLSRHSRSWGIQTTGVTVDIQKVMERKEAVVHQLREGSEKGLRKTEGLTLVIGEAAFLGPEAIRVRTPEGAEKSFTAPTICIDTGLRPNIPDLAGLQDTPYLTSTSLLEIRELPKHLLILGGNYLGLEFAQMFSRFGSQVTVLEREMQLLPREDADIAAAVKDILEAEGIRIRTGVQAKRVSPGPPVSVETEDGTFPGSHLLVAAGRVPNTEALALDKAGILTDEKGFIQVNKQLETNVKGIYAIGDVKGGPAFTHVAYNDHLILAGNLLEDARLSTAGRQIPYCMFTDPQLGRIGMTERQARAAGHDILIAKFPMEHTSRGIETGNTQGLMKAIVDKGSGKILGAAILGAEGGEVMSVLEMAMLAGLTAETIRCHVFAHPLYSESLNNLFMKLT